METFPRCWPFVRGVHRSPLDSLHKGQWRRAFMFSFTCAWTNGWANNRDASDLRRNHAHYDVTVMSTVGQWCLFWVVSAQLHKGETTRSIDDQNSSHNTNMKTKKLATHRLWNLHVTIIVVYCSAKSMAKSGKSVLLIIMFTRLTYRSRHFMHDMFKRIFLQE